MHEIILNPPPVCFRCRTPGWLSAVDGKLLCRFCQMELAREVIPAPLQQSEYETREICYICGKYVAWQNGCAYCNQPVCEVHSFTDEQGFLCCQDSRCKGEESGFQQSEYERLMDEVAHATQMVNEWLDRQEELIELARVARGREAELAPPLRPCLECGFHLCPECGACHSLHCEQGTLMSIDCREAIDDLGDIMRGEMPRSGKKGA